MMTAKASIAGNSNKCAFFVTRIILFWIGVINQRNVCHAFTLPVVDRTPRSIHKATKNSVPSIQYTLRNVRQLPCRSSFAQFRRSKISIHTSSIILDRSHVLCMTSSSSSSSSPAAERQHYSRSTNLELIPGMTTIDDTIDTLYDKLSKLRDSSLYFRLYSVDILGSCEYMSQELAECYAERCEIYPEDDDVVRYLLLTYCTLDQLFVNIHPCKPIRMYFRPNNL
jgi:hypothetical protein